MGSAAAAAVYAPDRLQALPGIPACRFASSQGCLPALRVRLPPPLACRRACELLRVGGRLVYSTCTFNPVEDEAVVAEVGAPVQYCCVCLFFSG